MLNSPTKMTDIKPTKPSEMLDLWVELKRYFMESFSFQDYSDRNALVLCELF